MIREKEADRASWWLLGSLQYVWRRQRRAIQLIKVESRTNKPEQDPCPNDNVDGGISKLINPEQQTLFSHIQFYSFLSDGHGVPVFGSWNLFWLFGQSVGVAAFLQSSSFPSWSPIEPNLDSICWRPGWRPCFNSGVVAAGDVSTVVGAFYGVENEWYAPVKLSSPWGEMCREDSTRFCAG